MTILFFDLETTGLLPNIDVNYRNLDKFINCRMVSIAWYIYDNSENLIKSKYTVIKPMDFNIDNNSKATKINKITNIIATNGSNINNVWNELANDLVNVDLLVAHNLHFDITVLSSELVRSGREDILTKLCNTDKYCTMINSTNICKIPFAYGKGYKYPKLQELHKYLFNYNFINDHNASSDAEATAKCYFKLKENTLYNAVEPSTAK